ncbi:MAG: GatB/YqeY domain-containing protein [Pseudomonadota bacterium]
MIRDRLSSDLKAAVETDDADRIATLRLICAAIKDRDIAVMRGDNTEGASEDEVRAILTKMIKQREESVTEYEESGRLDLASQERDEISVIREYLPRPFSENEMRAAIATAIESTGARSVRDINRVMAHLKAKHSGRMDFSRACCQLKQSFR